MRSMRAAAFVIAWLCVALVAGQDPVVGGDEHPSNEGSRADSEAIDALMDRVAMLTTDRRDPDSVCMGLLIAPDALLTYAHCITHSDVPVSWAFFGDSREAFFGKGQLDDDKKLPVHEHSNVTRRNTTNKPKGDVSVGDMDDWVRIRKTTIHPGYANDGSTPTMDLAVVRLQVSRVATKPFPLGATTTDVDTKAVFRMEAYQLTNGFVKAAGNRTKLLDLGGLNKVAWRYCLPPKTRLTAQMIAMQPKHRVCGVATAVERRRFVKLPNSFVTIQDKLVGLSVATSSASAGHQFIYLSDHADFITKTTQETDDWQPLLLPIFKTTPPSLRGYMSGLRQSKEAENFCLGSLIAPKFVLTAAHCVQNVEFSQVSVGSLFGSSEIDGEQIKVKKSIVHPKFNATTFSYDYAVVELEYISIQPPIALYGGSGAETEPGQRLQLYGYGPVTKDPENPGQLESLELPIMGKKQCKKTLQPTVLDESMLCAGGEEGRDACQGDSGGPLVYELQAPESLVAMSSSGRGCGIKGIPALYAAVGTAASFIDEHVDGHRWVTAYTALPTITTSTPASPAIVPTPSTSLLTSTKPTTNAHGTPTTPPVPAPTSRLEARLNDLVATKELRFLDEIATQERWTQATPIELGAARSSLVVGSAFVQLTRNVVSTTVLSAPSSLVNRSFEKLTKYSGATVLAFYSNEELIHLRKIISAFDVRPLRRRAVRFSREGGGYCPLPW